MSKKITWDYIYKEFKQKFPNWKDRVLHWRPHDYATILLYLQDGSKVAYNYDTGRLIFVED